MVSFTMTEDQPLLVSTINRYALNDVRKVAHDADETSTPPMNVVNTGWQLGIVPSAIPAELGGLLPILTRAPGSAIVDFTASPAGNGEVPFGPALGC